MAMETDPSQRGATLNLIRGPPGTSSYAGSEASVETATVSFATDSTIGDYFRDPPPPSPFHAQISRDLSNINLSAGASLPLLHIEDGDTFIFISPPASALTPEFASRRSTPLRVVSDILLSTGSQVFVQLLSPAMQQRHINRLVKQKKVVLIGGKLPPGVKYVLDLTPEDEGEKAVEWQEKLWCPDIVLQWKSNLVDIFEAPPSISTQERMAKELEEFRQTAWGDRQPTGEPGEMQQPLTKRDDLPEPYSFGRHVLALERLIHIIHGSDPLVKTTVDWYTLHCLSVAFGTTDATRDYIARWIFSNSLMIETHPAFTMRIAAEAGLATIASDAFAAAVMRAAFDPEGTAEIPGAPEAASALTIRAQNELKALLNMDWIDQYLPPTSDSDRQHFDPFRFSLRSYVSRQMMTAAKIDATDCSEGDIDVKSIQRSTWIKLATTCLASEMAASAPHELDSTTRFDIEQTIVHWNRWEASDEGENDPVYDLWKDVKSGAPHHPIPSVTQQTSTQDSEHQFENVIYDDATSEVASQSGTEIPRFDDDVKSISSTHTINVALQGLKTENPEPTFQESSVTLVEPQPQLIKATDPSPKTEYSFTADTAKIKPELIIKTEDSDETAYYPTATQQLPPNPTISVTNPLSQVPASDIGTPIWLQEKLITLSHEHSPARFWAVMHHPSHDLSKPAEPRIRCADCPDMLYFPGPDQSIENFRVHLRNIRHLNRVETRKRIEARSNGSGQVQPTLNPDQEVFNNYTRNNWPKLTNPVIEIPLNLLNIIRLCETYIKSKCAEMTARNIVFEPILLEEQLACLEESERSYMPVWSGGENIGSTRSVPHRGISDSSANDDMSVNVSTVGVGSVCTASSASTAYSYVDVDTPSASSSGSVISLSEDDDNDAVMSAPGETDDWVMSGSDDDEEFEMDDDAYFS
ncbi:hypothetical protein TWF730_006113 [Orbilia blumenaviensis]|uniref:Uncharacterized protein n=1 Tax=Orbilia blumenaviensis TaxID=1796055 RepID=A0AAV9TW86_9PEZI